MRLALTKHKQVLLGLALFMVSVPANAQQTKLRAKTILNLMAQRYAAFQSYQDEGVVVSTDDEPSGSSIRKLPFKTFFKRPKLFRFEWIDYSLDKNGTKNVVWSNGKESFTYWLSDRYEKSDNLGRAIAGATGISLGSAHTVPRLLIEDEVSGFTVAELVSPLLVGEELFEDALCYRIRGKNSQGKGYELWIGKRDLLLRKVREETKYPSYVAIEEEIRRNIHVNQPIPYAVFDFKPPIPLTPLKEPKAGSDLSDIFQDEAPTWKEFTSQEGRFSLLLPAEPHTQTLTLESPQGRFEHHVFTATRGFFVCIVDYVDLPGQFATPDNSKALFEASRDVFIKELDGKMASETAISVDGHTVWEVKINMRGGAARLRVLVVDARFYQLAIIEMNLDSAGGVEMDKFFNSFKIVSPRKPTAFNNRGLDLLARPGQSSSVYPARAF